MSGVIYGFSNGARAVAPLASSVVALLPGGYATLLDSLVAVSAVAAVLGFLAFSRRERQPARQLG